MSMNQPRDVQGLQRAVEQSIREHWKLFLIEGIVLVVLGLIAIVVPPIGPTLAGFMLSRMRWHMNQADRYEPRPSILWS